MDFRLFAHPMKLDIQIAVTFYDNWDQTTQRTFFLRNLHGESEAEQVAQARQILNGLASELYHLTRMGIDKGVIRVGGKKVEEVIYPAYRPPEKFWFFIYGVSLEFIPNFAYYWQKQVDNRQQRTWVLPEAKWDDG